MIEEYRPIEGYNSLYEISNIGNVRNSKGKILKPHKANNGFWQIALTKDKQVKYHYIHRLVAKTFIQQPEGFDVVIHKDKNKDNNKAANLEWTTKRDNLRHSLAKPIFAYNDNEIIEFDAVKDASRNMIESKGIYKALKKGIPFNGFRWAYIYDNNELSNIYKTAILTILNKE